MKKVKYPSEVESIYEDEEPESLGELLLKLIEARKKKGKSSLAEVKS